MIKSIFTIGYLFLIFNEIRGAVLAVPVLIAMWQAGGDLMAIWIGICTLAGIALSVIAPLWLAKQAGKIQNLFNWPPLAAR